MKRSMLVLVCLACMLLCACSPAKDDHGTQNNEIAAPAKEVLSWQMFLQKAHWQMVLRLHRLQRL